jgi:transcriptional regulator with XRE-family HTH domain
MKKALQEIFPVELKQYRIKKGLSQEAMARLLMVAARSYIDLEHGVTFPSALTLANYMLLLPEKEREDLLRRLRSGVENEE